MFNGKTRKLVSTAARNGYFFTLDRVTGEHIVTSKSRPRDELGQEHRAQRLAEARPGQRRARAGCDRVARLWRDDQLAAAAYSPDTRLFYVSEHNGYSIFYLTDMDPRGSMGLGGHEEVEVGTAGGFLTAIDPKTGKIAWRLPVLRLLGWRWRRPAHDRRGWCSLAMPAAISSRTTR